MAVFAINEWLWADVLGQNGAVAQRESFIAIVKLAESDHRLVIIEGSAFDRKAFALCKGAPMIAQRMAGVLLKELRLNSDRCHLLKPDAMLPLPKELAYSVKDDDHYLVQAQQSVPGAILVTTDSALREAVLRANLKCLSREDFLKTYC